MKVYKTQEEVDKDIHNEVLFIDGDVKFEFNVVVKGNINAVNIDAVDINAGNINAGNINARNINAGNINAVDINAVDINAGNINAWGINAWGINYYAVCFAYHDITCKSIVGRRDNSKHFCLDGEITIKQKEIEELTMEEVCKLLGREIKIKK